MLPTQRLTHADPNDHETETSRGFNVAPARGGFDQTSGSAGIDLILDAFLGH